MARGYNHSFCATNVRRVMGHDNGFNIERLQAKNTWKNLVAFSSNVGRADRCYVLCFLQGSFAVVDSRGPYVCRSIARRFPEIEIPKVDV